jgi:hypothetical protein
MASQVPICENSSCISEFVTQPNTNNGPHANAIDENVTQAANKLTC